MKTLLFVLMLFALPGSAQAQQPQDDLSKALTAAMQQKGVIGKNQVIVIDHTVDRAVGTGVGGEAVGDKATLSGEGSAPSVALPGASATGGDAKFKGTAEMVSKSIAFRWIAGIVGVAFLWMGWSLFSKGLNPKGGLVVGGVGLGLIVGAIAFPEWLPIALLLFLVVSVIEYAYRHSLLTGSIRTSMSAVHDMGDAAVAAFNKAASKFTEGGERNLIEKVAASEGAHGIKV